MTSKQQQCYKQNAAGRAVEFVEPGMALGFGSGSTAILAVQRIGELWKAGKLPGIEAVATSAETERVARSANIPMIQGLLPSKLDLTIDGADEVDPELNLIKGGGGALLREKVVAQASARVVIVVDGSKLSACLGTKHRLPVEVVPFGLDWHIAFIESIGGVAHVRQGENSEPFRTSQGNLILDCQFGPIQNLQRLAHQLESQAGVVAHGLFIGLATDCVIAGPDGARVESRAK